jgi:hypothetical protein
MRVKSSAGLAPQPRMPTPPRLAVEVIVKVVVKLLQDIRFTIDELSEI